MQRRRNRSAKTALLAVCALNLGFVAGAQAPNAETVLHTFTYSPGGGVPLSGLTFDAKGNLFGTTDVGGTSASTCGGDCGVVFELIRDASGGWAYHTIHAFKGSLADGGSPNGSVVFDAAGNLYGAAVTGGDAGCGVVYELSPTIEGPWKETIIHSFNSQTGNNDGCNPYSYLIFGRSGSLYGTTNKGGGGGTGGTFCFNGCGTVFEMTPGANGQWTENVIHSFTGKTGSTDGQNPYGGLVFDSAGNLWGTTYVGGDNVNGTAFRLTRDSAGTWVESAIFRFQNAATGFNPYDGLVIDPADNLYGVTVNGGLGNGVVFKLTLDASGRFTESLIHEFGLCGSTVCPDGLNPFNGLTIDSTGNLYGTAEIGGGAGGAAPNTVCKPGGSVTVGCGVVFKLTPASGGAWNETILRRFTGLGDGGFPSDDRLAIDSQGNIFGSASSGGQDINCPPSGGSGCGVVFEIRQ